MMNAFSIRRDQLRENPKVWFVTGVAGFIGSHLLQWLLENGQSVVGLDNYATGHPKNLAEVRNLVEPMQWKNFVFIEGDICDLQTCKDAVNGVDHVLHQAALGSVPRSLANPINTHNANINGFLNVLVAAQEEGVSSFTYAASSSTYGDHPALPKVEDQIGQPLSPYAVTKLVNEQYAAVFARSYKFNCIGLRYFNVFGPRQDPNGPYAAVIPKWTDAMLADNPVNIYGDGETSRDFCFVANAVQANILAATAEESCKNEVYNVAIGDCTSLIQLLDVIAKVLAINGIHYKQEPVYNDVRAGDVRHSQADTSKISRCLGYKPSHNIFTGLAVAVPWYIARHSQRLVVAL